MSCKRLPGYKRQSRLEEDKLVLKGRPYTVSTLNQLLEELNVFKVTTKENETMVGFFGEINPPVELPSICIQARGHSLYL